eukprot:TRINITY_DN6872_c0_g2_i1.p1 TRINITY_DN6872_c0_g2~~TRINITY_DN6872_c0_g2_i1.p1  ORF type:complete len:172 (-),score=26.17 TRINITY_DN6872_c0_g2_i1:282-797(-)
MTAEPKQLPVFHHIPIHDPPPIKKVKAKSSSILDSEGFRLRAACVCVRSDKEDEVLLVTRRNGPGWVIPGGKIEANELSNPSISAMREAREEAGVIGTLGRFLGEFENRDRGHRTRVFVLYVKELEPDWAESDGRSRSWFSFEEAQRLLRINKPIHSSYLDKLKQSQVLPK